MPPERVGQEEERPPLLDRSWDRNDGVHTRDVFPRSAGWSLSESGDAVWIDEDGISHPSEPGPDEVEFGVVEVRRERDEARQRAGRAEAVVKAAQNYVALPGGAALVELRMAVAALAADQPAEAGGEVGRWGDGVMG